jgi:glycosyltransferase involved in cell wall biosynthesis
MLRGKVQPGGQMRVFLNLCAGLDQLKVPYRVNDYKYAASHPHEVVGIVGKPHVLNRVEWRNPIVFGAAVYSHPSDDPDLLRRLAIRKVLVPGEWMREMCAPAWGDSVRTWPVGIDTERWSPAAPEEKNIDVLLYDKVMWERGRAERELIEPIKAQLQRAQMSVVTLRYGAYREEEFQRLLARSRMMIFLCEHETQGIAYQQALSCGVPILAWDRGGYWQDPSYYPDKVKFAPVTSVPYWDDRCGVKFKCVEEFPDRLAEFLDRQTTGGFKPRDYILENLTLEQCAAAYVSYYHESDGH